MKTTRKISGKPEILVKQIIYSERTENEKRFLEVVKSVVKAYIRENII